MELPKSHSKKCGICLLQAQHGKQNGLCQCWESNTIAANVKKELKEFNVTNINDLSKLIGERDKFYRNIQGDYRFV